MKILIVDDSKTERLILTSILTQLGHEVIRGENGQQAIELYQAHEPDLVLLDVIMPVMDGHEAARHIRTLAGEDWVPIIFLSAKVDPEDIAAGIEAGGDDYLTKPLDQTILGSKMKAMQRIAGMRHRLIEVTDKLEEANIELQRLANMDDLTGLNNRRHMDRFLGRMISRCSRQGSPLSMVMVDADRFKAYNDIYGHVAGDSCLRKIAKILKRKVTRPTDMVARYGGEEFAVILPETPVEGALHVAEAIRKGVEALGIPHKGSPDYQQVTISLGVYTQIPTPGTEAHHLISEADKALYQAKTGGRNRVTKL